METASTASIDEREPSPLDQAIDLVGGQSALARLLSDDTGQRVSQARVWAWVHRVPKVPAEFAIPIERVTGGRITRHQLRPDLYPPEA